MTNGNLIRNVTDAQLAELIDGAAVDWMAFSGKPIRIPWCRSSCVDSTHDDCIKCIIGWLHEPADAYLINLIGDC